MEIEITGRGIGVTDRFREYVEEKAEKIAHLAERALVFEVKVSRHAEKPGAQSGGNDRVELTLVGPGPVVRAEAEAADKYASFDIAIGRLLERVRRAKDRRKIHRGGQHRPESLRTGAVPVAFDALIQTSQPTAADAVSDEPGQADYCPVVIRTKRFASAPMTVDDALYYMELVGHDFYLFTDSTTGLPSVVYRRKGWDYGVIQLDEAAEVLQEDVTRERGLQAVGR
ncbi:ribosome-associated translation inhibitor RaiA [Gryllotalpicola sp.]|uniref:ribosome hibernation-promoting factor, HPF/YfiA family n=1 Tax=Gryllotalpicola sp. TaxID=1932787 RepID=UPI0026108EF0|nr:ribosome-associated translation inhibitor RaiA [Gryllotalpicola sp.]